MSSFKGALEGAIGKIIPAVFVSLYVIGVGTLISDDHRYTTKHLVAGIVLFPYALYVGGESSFRFISQSSEYRQREKQCLDAAEAQGIGRSLRLDLCECVASGGDVQQCAAGGSGEQPVATDGLTFRSSGQINRFAIDAAA